MSERERIINIILYGKLVADTSVADLAREGNVDAQIAIYEGTQGNIRGVFRASAAAIKAAKLPLLEFYQNQIILVNEVPLVPDDNDPNLTS